MEESRDNPYVGVSVTIELAWHSRTLGTPETVAATPVPVATRVATRTSGAGLWEVDLVPNDLIEPLGLNVYKVITRVRPYAGFPVVSYVYLADTVDPDGYRLGNASIVRPDWVNR